MRARGEERGQASIELTAGAAVTLLVALVALQLLAAGYAVVMADHAAEAAALALVNGRAPAAAARSAVPGWPEGASRIQVQGDAVLVTLVPPSPFKFVRAHLAATGRAAVRRPVAAAGRWAR